MDEIGASCGQDQRQIRFVSKRAPDYKLEFINGAISNITPRGGIVCDFHCESRDRPTEQFATIAEDGKAVFGEFQDTGFFNRDVKFGIIINIPFAKDLVEMLNKKIKEREEIFAKRTEEGEHK